MTLSKSLAPLLCALVIAGCGDDNLNDAEYFPPSNYTFSSRLNTDFQSSVSNEEAITQELIASELVGFMSSAEIIGLSSGSVALLRLNKFYELGTTVDPEDITYLSLVNFDVYTGSSASSTAILRESNSQLPLSLLSFSAWPVETNLISQLSGAKRKLPYRKTVGIDVEGTVVDTEVGAFYGWPELEDVTNGDHMPSYLLGYWLEEVSALAVDGSVNSPVINETGMHLDLLVKQMLLGRINYSTLMQNNLISDGGLVKQNSLSVNFTEVEDQLADVEFAEERLTDAKDRLESAEEALAEIFAQWSEIDPIRTNPLEPRENYENNYLHTTLAESYFDKVDEITDKSENVVNRTTQLEEANAKVEDLLPYTDLEKNWDEALGYFGAAINYGDYSDAEIVSQLDFDNDGDGLINPFSEMNFGYAVLASQRDHDAALANTNFSGDIWNAFLTGRQIILQSHGREASEGVGYHIDLTEQADVIRVNLEKVVAASIVHYLNSAILSLDNSDALASFDNQYFKDWSNLKGMALSLQFNDVPVLSEEQLGEFHSLIKDSPITNSGLVLAHQTDLLNARDIIQAAYGFASANVEAW